MALISLRQLLDHAADQNQNQDLSSSINRTSKMQVLI